MQIIQSPAVLFCQYQVILPGKQRFYLCLWKIGKVSSPLCPSCKEEEETADHIIFRCKAISSELHEEGKNNYRKANHLDNNDYIDADFIGLLNTSRHQPFTESCIKVIKSANLRTSIIL